MKLLSKTLATAFLLSNSAWAGPEQLQRDSAVPFVIIDQELSSVLEEFGSSAGIPMTIDRRISGRVSNFNAELSAKGFLDQITSDHSLVWYFDGSTIHITPAAANGSVVIDFGQVTADSLNATLEEMGVAGPRFAVRRTENTGIVTEVVIPKDRIVERPERDSPLEALGGRMLPSGIVKNLVDYPAPSGHDAVYTPNPDLKIGDYVKKGTVLYTMRNASLDGRVQQAE